MEYSQSLSGYLTPYSHEKLTVDATSGGVTFTAAKLLNTASVAEHIQGPARHILITTETAPFRWTIDGTAPTTTVGHLANAGSVIELANMSAMKAFRAIRTTSTSAELHVTYER